MELLVQVAVAWVFVAGVELALRWLFGIELGTIRF